MIKIKRCALLIAAGFAMTLFFCQASEADVEETAARFNQASEVTTELFLAAYDRHGSSARISAVLVISS